MPKRKRKKRGKNQQIENLFINFPFWLIFILPVALYVLTVAVSRIPPLDIDGYKYLSMFHFVTHGKTFPLQTTVPKPLLIYLFGVVDSMFSAYGLYILEIVAFSMISFILAYHFKDSQDGKIFALDILLLFIFSGYFVLQIFFNNSTLWALLFINLAVYFLFKNKIWLTTLFLFLANLTRPTAWGATLGIVIYLYFKNHRRLKNPRIFVPALALLAIPIWMFNDFLLSRGNWIYSVNASKLYYVEIFGKQMSRLKLSSFVKLTKVMFNKHFDSDDILNFYLGFLGLILFATIKNRKIKEFVKLWSFIGFSVFLGVYIIFAKNRYVHPRIYFLLNFWLIILTVSLLFAVLQKFKLSSALKTLLNFVFLFAIIFWNLNWNKSLRKTTRVFSREATIYRNAKRASKYLKNHKFRRVSLPGRRVGLMANLMGYDYYEKFVPYRKFLITPEKVKDTLKLDYVLHFKGDYPGKLKKFFRNLDIIKEHGIILYKGKIVRIKPIWLTPDSMCVLYETLHKG